MVKRLAPMVPLLSGCGGAEDRVGVLRASIEWAVQETERERELFAGLPAHVNVGPEMFEGEADRIPAEWIARNGGAT